MRKFPNPILPEGFIEIPQIYPFRFNEVPPVFKSYKEEIIWIGENQICPFIKRENGGWEINPEWEDALYEQVYII